LESSNSNMASPTALSDNGAHVPQPARLDLVMSVEWLSCCKPHPVASQSRLSASKG